jgi:hypothetical protein
VQQWEYQRIEVTGEIVESDGPMVDNLLRERGLSGWELAVGVAADPGSYWLFLKRPKPPISDQNPYHSPVYFRRS